MDTDKKTNTGANDEWMDVTDSASVRAIEHAPSVQTEVDHQAFLLGEGLSFEDAAAVCDALGAGSMEDLALVDAAMAREAASTVGLKPIATKRLLMALGKAGGANGSAASAPVTPTVEPRHGDATQDIADGAETVVREAVVICVDRSGSMGSEFHEQKSWGDNCGKTLERRSRMDAVKQVFYAFRDRTDSLGASSKHQLGLMQFDDEVEVMLQLTGHLNRFESIVDNMKHRGRTAIYSSIVEAVGMLQTRAEDSPQTDLRVLVLTDGKNNAGAAPQTALRAALKIGAVVDAVIVGEGPDENLLKIVAATGGQCFQIRTLSDGFELMEAESVVSLRARRGDTEQPELKPMPSDEELDKLFAAAPRAEVKSSNYGASAGCADLPQAKKVTSLEGLAKRSAQTKSAGGAVAKRVMRELDSLSSDPAAPDANEGCHLFPDTENIHLMRALIEGPPGTPFEGGVFLLNVSLPQDYPFKPPRINFVTPVFHCNINDCGGICLDILKDAWSPALTIPKCLQAVRSMLGDPNTDDAMRQWIAELTLAHQQHGDQDTRYVDSAREMTIQHASKTVAEWRSEWGLDAAQ